jgi:signal transduction histidine kinase
MAIVPQIGLPEQLSHLRTEWQRSVQRRDIDLLSDAAHEIRSPLARLKGYGDLLAHGQVSTDEIQGLGERIRRQAERLAGTVDDILELAQIEAHGGRNFRLRETDLHALIIDVLDSLPVEQSERISVIHTEEPLPPVLVDRARISRALANVLDNACKYSVPGRPITVRASLRRPAPEAVWIAIHVRDQGIGINEEDSRRAFERFYRAEAVCQQTGSGLGLAIAEQIVRLHRGRIQLRGRLGQGTIAALMLPAKAR